MAFNKEYYQNRKKEVQEELDNVVGRLVADIYNFVSGHQRLQAKVREIEKQEEISLKESEKKIEEKKD